MQLSQVLGERPDPLAGDDPENSTLDINEHCLTVVLLKWSAGCPFPATDK